VTPPKIRPRKKSRVVVLSPAQEEEMCLRYIRGEAIASALAQEYGLTRGALLHRVGKRKAQEEKAAKLKLKLIEGVK